jgi:hypothetical protein
VPAFAPEPFSVPVVSPETASFSRRIPYLSPAEYKATPTAIAANGLIPGGSAAENLAALVNVIARASDLVDTICFHRPDGTLAACPTTESGWIRPKDDGSLLLQCNFKPVIEVTGLALGISYASMSNIGQTAAEALTIQGRVIQLPGSISTPRPALGFPGPATVRGKVLAVWTYVNGFPHTALAKAVEAEEKEPLPSFIEVEPSEPGGTDVYGIYPGTQLTIHDGADTEVVVVSSVEGLKLNLLTPPKYEHKLPEAPNSTRVSAIPWDAEQACILLVSYLIKTRGSRALVIPSSPSKAKQPPKQADGQAGASDDYDRAVQMLQHYSVPYLRSNA